MIIKRLPKEVQQNKEFGSLIKKMRLECGLSQEELAHKIGFETGTAISLIEDNQRKVSANMLYKITQVCGYSFEIKEI